MKRKRRILTEVYNKKILDLLIERDN